CLQGYNTPYNF
nr:immunoglobulin light chain junction region [Macaca mulatta]MOV80363.1 immunoglobulin light chain junction region [Macaca mulatta]MOV80452.1 immunoglobulin light chain junction region [Macaca mulatta]MOV81377.1 immunoglobulin light chain junction region [Macaca mulatta]MOV81659.1 immunoglobulin light chain junction region [Macaca mulatta]